MARRRQKQPRNEALILALLVLLVATGIISKTFFDEWSRLGFITLIVITPVVLAIVIVIAHQRKQQSLKRLRAFQLVSDIDYMSGVEFEGYINALLQMKGYKTKSTPHSGDLGIDLVATKQGEHIAVQIKRYSHAVDRRAVSDAVAGMKHYHCTKAMVITNNYFRPGAHQLAASNRCVLIDRDILADWIAEFQTY